MLYLGAAFAVIHQAPMSEGHVYVCHWQRNDRGFEGWIERWPERHVTGATFNEMRDALGNITGDELGDGEPQFEFEPPFIEAADWEHLFRHGWRSTFFLTGVRPTTDTGLFDGGFCNRCNWPVGDRTNEPLKVGWATCAKGGRSFAAISHRSMRIPVASEPLLDIFTPQERDSFEARPVETEEAMPTRFYEFVPRRFVSKVAGKPFQPDGWQCRQCGRRYVSNAKVLGYGAHVVSRDAIEPGAGLFFLGDPGKFSLCFSAERWQAVKAALRAAEISSSSIAIIDPSEIEQSPALRDHKS